MTSPKLIELDDGILIEVRRSPDEVEEIAGGITKKVRASIDDLAPMIVNIVRPLSAAFHTLRTANRVATLEFELGMSFEASGNLYVVDASTAANFKIKVTMKPSQTAARSSE